LSGVRGWIGKLMLHAPESIRSLRKVPLLSGVIHALSHKVVALDERIWVSVETGPAQDLQIELNPRTGHAYARGEAELAVQKFLAGHLKPDDVFYDLGANIGLFTLIAARITAPRGRVFSFEPDPQNASRLQRNVERNGFSNVTIVESGVWSSTTELRFAVAPESSPDRGVGSFVLANPAASDLVIPCVSLDDFARSNPPPTAIKCDVEGAEMEVLKGARSTLAKSRPWILCEMHSPENDRGARQFLAGLHYSCTEIDPMHVFAAP
jgi:FkbM family methyltransferase